MNVKKKSVNLLLTSAVLTAVMLSPVTSEEIGIVPEVYAEESISENAGVSFSLMPVYTKNGNEFSVPVYAEVREGFAAFTIDIEYDGSLFTPVSIERSGNLSGFFVGNTEYGKDVVRAVYAGAVNCTESGEIFNVRFKAHSPCDAVGRFKLNVRLLSNTNYEDITHDESDSAAGISVNDYLPIYAYFDESENSVSVMNLSDSFVSDFVLYSVLYDNDGRILSISGNMLTAQPYERLTYAVDLSAAAYARCFVWDKNMQSYSLPDEYRKVNENS